MREYDFAFSLGFCCTLTEAMRAEGLQFASAPFDWVGVSSLGQAVRLVADDFKDWFERDLLDLWDVRISGGFVTRVYKNRKTGIGFVHDFSNVDPIEEKFDAVKKSYDKRIDRFLTRVSHSKRVLAVYMELPKIGRISNACLCDFVRTLRARFPNTELDLLYFYEDPSSQKWRVEEDSGGVTVVSADYRVMLDGKIMHLCRSDQLRECLRAFVSVPDIRTDAEKAEFDAYRRRRHAEMQAGNAQTRLGRWLNKRAARLFRDIEAYLERQKLLPADRPLWFDGDGK